VYPVLRELQNCQGRNIQVLREKVIEFSGQIHKRNLKLPSRVIILLMLIPLVRKKGKGGKREEGKV
jgi:hypothetical protein